ncbi:MAG: YraN family protein [Actinobacteria bacterium]|nr:MAG: YraN family protein [Actinomycetota bacterium]
MDVPSRRGNRRAAVGRYGEDVACRYLAGRGMRVLARNWRSGRWEADIIAADGDALVLCEVKTRTTAAFGLPEEAITAAKATRLRRLAAAWLQQCDRDELSTPVVQVRIDVVAVQVRRRGAPQVRHLIGVC